MTAQMLTLVPNRSPDIDLLPSNLTPTIATALICDSAFLRSGLQYILRDTPFAMAEAAAVTGPKRFHYCALDIALVVIEASQNSGRVLEVVRQVREWSPQTRIVALADQFNLSFVRAGHEAGINGFCPAASAPDVLIKSLELVMLGETVLPFETLRSIMDQTSQAGKQPVQDNSAEGSMQSDLKACKLSAREMEILRCLTKGEANKVIARNLEITEATIKVHIKAILRKTGASNRTQAAMWASQRLPGRGGASVNG